MKFRCPHCGQKLAAEEEEQGEQVECPRCHEQFAVPLASDRTEASVPQKAHAPQPPPRSASGSNCLSYLILIVSLAVLVWCLVVRILNASRSCEILTNGFETWEAASSSGSDRSTHSERKREKPPEMSSMARMGKAWVDRNLPPRQKMYLETGVGSSDDRANLMANLVESGHMDEVIAYMEYLQELSEWVKDHEAKKR